MALEFTITNAGRAALVNAANNGTAPITITQIALGSGYAPATPSRTGVTTEIKRLVALGGGTVSPDTIHVTGKDVSTDEYAVKEIGLYTNTGILLAIHASSSAVITKAAGTFAVIACDLVITSLPPGSITVGDVTLANPPATEAVMGVAEIATEAETLEGTDDSRIVTPKKLFKLTATLLRRGLIRLATAAEAIAGTDTERALTPATLAAVTATTARRGLIEIATDAEAVAGTDQIRALTPSHLSVMAGEFFKMLYPVGEILITRREGNPSTWLGFGSWERYGAGRVLAGHDPADTDFNALDKTGGAKAITLSVGEIPGHTHSVGPFAASTSSAGEHYHFIASTGNGNPGSPELTTANHLRYYSTAGGSETRYGLAGEDSAPNRGRTTTVGNHTHTISIEAANSGSVGGGSAHSNLQPYVVVFMWKRTA